ncbi:putative endo-beta-1,4-xylanase [Penicillium oxalicum 114-2]|uniref:Endo-1,4-beta-xylanase n=2 Tax=Penicillium TaxID=5073 RepID=D3JYP8_PENDC|nr:xylanase I [Penicillium decumbens]EPS30259.1 putative endo-beta-1,4-xylanase [Penicillium oxalicum 114-2]
MVSFTKLFVAASAVLGAWSAPTPELAERQAITKSQTGMNNGFYYSFWTNGGGQVSYTNGAAGQYSVNWNNAGDFTCGKGWSKGAARNIKFEANFKPSGNAYLGVYGWTKGPLIEYYILENYGSYNPGSGMQHKGTVYSDGSNYDIYQHTQVNQPSISGTQTFNQYWSIRQSKRSSGTVTTGNHFNAWAKLGMKLGAHDYQVLLTEGYHSSGTSTVTVSA